MKTEKNPKQKLKAFSLIELTVSMAIVGVIMAMLSNVLVNSIVVSQKSIGRSFVREEITDISDRISNDLREAARILECEGELTDARCRVESTEGTVTWEICPATTGELQVCKKDNTGNILFLSSPNLKVTGFTFEQGFDIGGNAVKKNIVLTIIGDHMNEAFNVKNILRQVSISTRNYFLQASGQVTSILPTQPVLTLNTNTIIYSGYTTGGLPTLVDSGLTLTAGQQITSASVAITSGFVTGTDFLDFTTFGSIIGSYNQATGILTLSGSDTPGNYERTLRTVSYRALQLGSGCSGSRQITFTAGNASGNSSSARTLSLLGTVYTAPSGTINWYGANVGTTTSNGRIDSWTDQSGQNNTLTRIGAGGTGPLLIANSLNNKPVARFDQAGTCGATKQVKLMSIANVPISGNVAISQIVLARPNAGSGLFLSGFGPSGCIGTCWAFLFNQPNTAGSINYGLHTSSFGSAPTTTGPNIVYLGKNPGSMASTAVQFFNGVSIPQTGGTAGNPNFTSGRLIVGELFSNSTCYLWNGDLAETMMFNKVLTTSERQSTEQYLAGKWWHSGFASAFTKPTPTPSSCAAPPPASPPTNVSIGKPAYQISTYSVDIPTKAVDGNTNTNYSAGSVTHTQSQTGSWWYVDLTQTYTLTSINIWNRGDCCSDRLSNFYVRTYANAADFAAGVASWTSYFPGIAQFPTTFTPPLGVQARYVMVQLGGTNPLSLTEVQVFGY
jgi:prepilin-type N-terminal cleavage/methylation domain-containing protein